MRVLVVEDNALLRHHLREQLEACMHRVTEAANAEEGLYYASEFPQDIAIIDLGLPGMDGIECIRRMRQQGFDYPILILTARGNWEDKVEGLQVGADDYVVKPFQFEELEARLNALLRRSSGFAKPTIEAGTLRLELNRKQAFADEELIPLTAYEYQILEYLMRHYQQVVSKERLMAQLYDDSVERAPNTIEVLVGRLRRKLESSCGEAPIETIRSQGYLFNRLCR